MKNSIRTGLLAIGLTLTAGTCLLPAQTVDRRHLSVEAYARCNDFWGKDIRNNLLNTHVSGLVGVTAGLTTLPEDGNWYEWAYNYPTFGIGLSHDFAGLLQGKAYLPKDYSNTPVDSRLGDIVNLYGWAQFDWIRTRAFRFGPAIELGLAYSDICHDYKNNPGNRYIGSHVFFDVGFGLHAECFLTPQWALTGGLYATHHSNAMHTARNAGTNELSLSVGTRYYLAPVQFTPRSAVRPDRPEYPKGLHLQVSAAAGVLSFFDEQDVYDGNRHPGRRAPARPRVVLCTELVWRYTPVSATGVGVEGGWSDNSYWMTDVLKTGREDDPDNYSPYHAGVYLTQEFHYRQMSFRIAAGSYVFKRTGLEDRLGRMLLKAGARYHFARLGGLFAGVDLRDTRRGLNLEWTLGYRF